MRAARLIALQLVLLGNAGGCGTSATAPAGVTPAGTNPTVGSPAADGCTADALGPGERTETLLHDGVQRTYIVHVPASYTGKVRVPLVLDIHGLTSNAMEQAAISGWRAKSDSVGFVVIWPNGLDSS